MLVDDCINVVGQSATNSDRMDAVWRRKTLLDGPLRAATICRRYDCSQEAGAYK